MSTQENKALIRRYFEWLTPVSQVMHLEYAFDGRAIAKCQDWFEPETGE